MVETQQVTVHITALGEWVLGYFLFFGVLTIVGGVMGYVKARSVASVAAGGISGGLLLVGTALTWSGHFKLGPAILLIVSLGLLGRFAPALLRGKLNPAVYVAPMALVAVLIAGYILYVVVVALPAAGSV